MKPRSSPIGSSTGSGSPRSGVSRRSFLIAIGGAGALAGGALLGRSCQAPPGSPIRLRNVAELPEDRVYDVCIVGSGPAGAVLGRDLVQREISVVMLESGLDLRTQSFDPTLRTLEAYRSSGPIDYPVAASRVRGVGGTSIVWSGACTRFHAIDFAPNPYPVDAGWPIRFPDVAPYYDLADETLRVRRGLFASFHPTLSRELDRVGVEVGGSPKSRRQLWSGPVRAASDWLPELSRSPWGTLVSGATATRLLPDASGNVAGVAVRGLDGRAATVRARVYVVACGGLESARLLLLSRSVAYPQGIGNASDLVGRHFMEHTGTGFRGAVRDWRTFHAEFGRSEQFYDGFKKRGLGGVILVFRRGPGDDALLNIGAGTEMAPNPDNRVSLAPNLTAAFGNPGLDLRLGFSPIDLRTMDETRKLIRRIFSDLRADDVHEIEGGSEDWGHHHMGACRMGVDPSSSVVDQNLRVHGTRNLYVAGSSVFSTSGAAHPTLLIVALSHRLADHLVTTLERPARNAGRRRRAQEHAGAATGRDHAGAATGRG